MQNSPLVTIMIPTYDQPDYLPQAVESSLAQTYGNLEIIIADDCSPSAEAKAVLEKYEGISGVRVCRNNPNLGRVANYRRTLFELAQGEWVINLDGDDYFYDDSFIQQAMEFVAGNDHAVMVSGVFMDLSPQGVLSASRSNQGPARFLDSEQGYEGVLDGSYFPFHGSTIYRRKAAIDADFYSRDVISADLESLLRLVQKGSVATVPCESMVRRRHGENVSASLCAEDFITDAVTFSAPLEVHDQYSLVSREFLHGWIARYAFRKGKDNGYKILKNTRDNSGYLRYLRTIAAISPASALKVFLQPKHLLKMLGNL